MDLRKLDRAMKEAFCELDLSGNKQAQTKQKELFLQIADEYENGSEDTPRDKWKAYYFRKKAGIKADPPRSEIFSTHFMHSLIWYLNDIRLKAIYTNTALGIIGKSFLPVLFGLVGGILYLGRLFIDLTICLVTVLRQYYQEAKANKEGRACIDEETIQSDQLDKDSLAPLIKFWKRFQLVLNKDKRPDRILNDVVWGPINLLSFFIPVIAIPLVLIAVSYDLIRVSISVFSSDSKYSRLISETESQLSNARVSEETEELKYVLTQAGDEHKKAKTNVIYAGFCNTLILVGLMFIMFPPTLPAGAGMMLTGSVLLFGPALKTKIKSLVTYLLKDNTLDHVQAKAVESKKSAPKYRLALKAAAHQASNNNSNITINSSLLTASKKITSPVSIPTNNTLLNQSIPEDVNQKSSRDTNSYRSCYRSFWEEQYNNETVPSPVTVGNPIRTYGF